MRGEGQKPFQISPENPSVLVPSTVPNPNIYLNICNPIPILMLDPNKKCNPVQLYNSIQCVGYFAEPLLLVVTVDEVPHPRTVPAS